MRTIKFRGKRQIMVNAPDNEVFILKLGSRIN